MYAVMLAAGKQYRVTQGLTLKVDKLAAEVGSTIDFDQVLIIADGDTLHLGAPFVKQASVRAVVLQHARLDKIHIIKHKRRKHHHKEMGHRQWYTLVKIDAISAA
jgi:large subunit ribosomal protein L21